MVVIVVSQVAQVLLVLPAYVVIAQVVLVIVVGHNISTAQFVVIPVIPRSLVAINSCSIDRIVVSHRLSLELWLISSIGTRCQTRFEGLLNTH